MKRRKPLIAKVYHIRITLDGTKPPIWRRVAVASNITLGELHEVIQIVMGWTDSHLHEFILRDKKLKLGPQDIAKLFQQGALGDEFLYRVQGERHFVTKMTPWGEPSEMDGEDENAVTLEQVCPKVKSKLIYEYDFGDGWTHVIETQKILEPDSDVNCPVCLAGKKACPPEDCGGVGGYYGFLRILSDPKDEQYEEILEWIGDEFDPDVFDLEDVNASLAQWRK